MKLRNKLSLVLVVAILLTSFMAVPQTNAAAYTATVNAATTYQTLEGFGAAIAWMQSYITEHPNKAELYKTLFADSGLDILRLRNQYRNVAGFDYESTEIVKTAKQMNPALKILLTSWSPPADLKLNGVLNGGTLIKDSTGAFVYSQFGNYWLNSLNAYKTKGIVPDYISIQNEPDYENSGWETCILKPTEDANYPSYGKALDAVYSKISTLSPIPKILASECTGVGSNLVQNYANNMDLTKVYGVAHHLYNGGDGNTPDSFNSIFQTLASAYTTKPLFQTEYDYGTALNTAQLICNALTVEGVSSYFYWDLVWDNSQKPLVVVDNPFNQSGWANPKGFTPSDYYYALQHFAKYTDPGYKRVAASASSTDIKITSFISPDSKRLTTVLVNGASTENTVALTFNGFTPGATSVYRSTFSGTTERFASLGSLSGNTVTMPSQSVVTVVADVSSTGIVTPTPLPTATPKPTSRSAFDQIEAESYNSMSGVQTELMNDTGNRTVGYIEPNDYICYTGVDFGTGATGFQASVSSATSGGNIEIRLDGAYNTTVATIPVTGMGDWSTYANVSAAVSGLTGKHDLYLFFTGSSGYLFNMDWFKFTGGGSTSTPTPTPTPSTATATPTPTPSTATPTATPSTATPTPTPTPSTATSTPTPSTATPTPTPSTATPTPTPSTATPTPTPTAGTPAPGGIKVQFFNGNTAATSNTLYPNFKVVNTGTTAVNLSDVKMRYYFTNDGTQANSFACDYSTAGSGNVTSSFTTIAKTNADRYLEVGFSTAAGTLGAGASVEVKARIWKSDWSNFTQTNDYSFNATATNYVDSTTVTGYIAGALKWGTEP